LTDEVAVVCSVYHALCHVLLASCMSLSLDITIAIGGLVVGSISFSLATIAFG
jgi:hypothetical protein